MRGSQKTVKKFIEDELIKLNLLPLRLSYRKDSLVDVETADGVYTFSYKNTVRIIKRPTE